MIRIKVANVIITTDTYSINAKTLATTLTIKAATLMPIFFKSAKKNQQLIEVILDEYSFLPEHADISGECKLVDITAEMDEIIDVYRSIAKSDKYYNRLKAEQLILPKDISLNKAFRKLTLDKGKNYKIPSKKDFRRLIDQNRK